MIVDLTLKRLDRLEKAVRETNQRMDARFGRIEDALGRVVTILEAHSQHFERMEDALFGVSERIDRLTSAIARGRTQDLARFDDHERRIRAIERHRHPRTPRPRKS